jgi:hypothetical protein
MSEKNEDGHRLSTLMEAVGRWDNEGGALTMPPGPDLALPLESERLLRCLGMAVVLRWNELPTEVQRDLFESAVSANDPIVQRDLTQQLGRYLHRQAGS